MDLLTKSASEQLGPPPPPPPPPGASWIRFEGGDPNNIRGWSSGGGGEGGGGELGYGRAIAEESRSPDAAWGPVCVRSGRGLEELRGANACTTGR